MLTNPNTPSRGGQSRLASFIEVCINTIIGFGVGMLSQMWVFPLVGIHVSVKTNFIVCCWFTAISIIRSYVIRRWFNRMLSNTADRVASKITFSISKER